MNASRLQNAIEITEAGGPEVLKLVELPVPRPGPSQILVEVAAAGVNRHDCHQRSKGIRHDGLGVPGLEVAGTVVELGAEVTGLSVGTKVMALTQGGGYAQYALAEAALTMPVPEGLNMVEAACVPEAIFTTWWNFFGLLDIKRQDFALIHGGASGVGHIALQALSALGYRVFATAGTSAKLAAALSFGAEAAFDYHDPDLARKVVDATGGQGIGALLDMSAGAHIDQDLEMMAPDGRIAHLSGGGGKALALPLAQVMAKRIRVTGSLLRPLPLAMKTEVAARIRAEVLSLIGQRVRPVIAQAFPLLAASSAHRELERNTTIGKIVLRVA